MSVYYENNCVNKRLETQKWSGNDTREHKYKVLVQYIIEHISLADARYYHQCNEAKIRINISGFQFFGCHVTQKSSKTIKAAHLSFDDQFISIMHNLLMRLFLIFLLKKTQNHVTVTRDQPFVDTRRIDSSAVLWCFG